MTTLFVIGGTFVLIVIPGVILKTMLVGVVGIVLMDTMPPWIDWLRSQAKPNPGGTRQDIGERVGRVQADVERRAAEVISAPTVNVCPGANAVDADVLQCEETTILDNQ